MTAFVFCLNVFRKLFRLEYWLQMLITPVLLYEKKNKSYKSELYYRSLCYCSHEILPPSVMLIYCFCNIVCITLLYNYAGKYSVFKLFFPHIMRLNLPNGR